jgi:hypothetical protein
MVDVVSEDININIHSLIAKQWHQFIKPWLAVYLACVLGFELLRLIWGRLGSVRSGA